MLLQIHPAAKLFLTIITRVNKCVGKVDALDVAEQIYLDLARLLADGALEHLCLGVEDRVLLEYASRIS